MIIIMIIIMTIIMIMKTRGTIRLKKHQIRGRRGVSAAVSQGKGSFKRIVFSQTPVSRVISVH